MKFFLLFASALLLTACDSMDMDHGSMVPENDVAFIDGMVPHHRMAIDMSEMVIERGSRDAVEAIAERIRAAQVTEIAEMEAAREELTGSATVPPMDDPHGDADMARMQSLSGDALDRFFLEHMIPHHAGALQMAHNALPNLERADMRRLAQEIIDAQTEEIEELQALLDAGGA